MLSASRRTGFITTFAPRITQREQWNSELR